MKNPLNLLIFLLIVSCQNKENSKSSAINSQVTDTVNILKENDPYVTNYENKGKMKKLLDSAIINGDTLSYQEGFKDFMVSGNLQEFLYYSMKMAQNHNYKGAYFDSYYILNLLNNKNGYLSPKDKNEALFYLLKAYEMGDTNAKSKINALFIKKNIKIPSSSSIINEGK